MFRPVAKAKTAYIRGYNTSDSLVDIRHIVPSEFMATLKIAIDRSDLAFPSADEEVKEAGKPRSKFIFLDFLLISNTGDEMRSLTLMKLTSS